MCHVYITCHFGALHNSTHVIARAIIHGPLHPIAMAASRAALPDATRARGLNNSPTHRHPTVVHTVIGQGYHESTAALFR